MNMDMASRNPNKSMSLITPTSNCFSLEQLDNGAQHYADHDVSYEQVWSRSLFDGADKNQPIPYMPRKKQTCKKIPVKETTCVQISMVINSLKNISFFFLCQSYFR